MAMDDFTGEQGGAKYFVLLVITGKLVLQR